MQARPYRAERLHEGHRIAFSPGRLHSVQAASFVAEGYRAMAVILVAMKRSANSEKAPEAI